jgi:hypothetical protein
LRHQKGRTTEKANKIDKCREKKYMEQVYFLEPIPKNFGYSLGGYSHREHYHAPDRKKSTKERRRVEAGNKEQIDEHEV